MFNCGKTIPDCFEPDFVLFSLVKQILALKEIFFSILIRYSRMQENVGEMKSFFPTEFFK